MKLKIVSKDWILFEGDVEEVIVPTLDWEAGILPWHALYTAVLKWGLCKIKTKQDDNDLLSQWDYKLISVWEGVVYTDWKEIRIATWDANAKIEASEEELEEMKKQLEKELEEIKAKWSVEEIEKALIKMNKLIADIELVKLKK